MRDTDLFQLALGLLPPWLVKDCQFSVSEQRLDLYIDFAKGGSFTCADCGRQAARRTTPRSGPGGI